MAFSDLGYEKLSWKFSNMRNNHRLLFIQKLPFTTKAPVHVIEALDTVAEEFGMSRNAFVLKL